MRQLFIILFLSAALAACGEMGTLASSPDAPNALLAIPEKALDPSLTLKAFVTVDSTDYDLTVFSTYVGGTVTGITGGTHTFVIHLQTKNPFSTDVWVDIITVTKTVVVASDGTATLQTAASDLVYPDIDGDGVTNLDEVTQGTDPTYNGALGTVPLGITYTGNTTSQGQCGWAGNTVLSNPFGTDSFTVNLTEVYSINGKVVPTGLSKWQFLDNAGAVKLEVAYQPTVSVITTPFNFTTSDGMTCVGTIMNHLSTPGTADSFDGSCSKSGDKCDFRYREPI